MHLVSCFLLDAQRFATHAPLPQTDIANVRTQPSQAIYVGLANTSEE